MTDRRFPHGFVERVHPRRGAEKFPLAAAGMPERARELLGRLPRDLVLPVPKGDRDRYQVPQEFWGCSREELQTLVTTGEMPFQ